MKVAFGHKARSGKDEAVNFLVDMYGGTNFKFAQPLHDMNEYLYSTAGLPFKKDAKLMQMIGTEWGRALDPDIWVKVCLANIDLHERTPFFVKSDNTFISDMRFTNEAEALKKEGFILVKVERSLLNRGAIGRDPTHPSETCLDDYVGWDYVIDNNGTLEEFHTKISSLYLDILDRPRR